MKNNIKEIRKKKEMTLKDLSILTNLSEGYLCHLEKGSRENPTYSTMSKISKALEKEIGDIFEIDK